jgi:GR25 family glycosyltransferase involved in LPS biosynthesis
MDYATKLKNFPSVNYISLYDNHERREFMENQFKKYGMRGVVHLNHPYSKLKEYVKVIPEHSEEWIGPAQLGITISHLMMIRNWLESTDEPYAIFTEDDISFKSVEYWNFIWDDFMGHLPKDWECVQLLYLKTDGNVTSLKLRGHEWDDWAVTAYLTKRSYAKKLIES